MTLDVKALRDVCERIIDLDAKRENAPDFAHRAAAHAALSMACETFAHTLTPLALLALLDRLERAEAKAAAGLELRRTMLLGVDTGATRRCAADALRAYDSTLAALDDEAPR